MNVVVTGSSSGMGREIALKFLTTGHTVYGLDIKESTIDDNSYYHYICDVAVQMVYALTPPLLATYSGNSEPFDALFDA